MYSKFYLEPRLDIMKSTKIQILQYIKINLEIFFLISFNEGWDFFFILSFPTLNTVRTLLYNIQLGSYTKFLYPPHIDFSALLTMFRIAKFVQKLSWLLLLYYTDTSFNMQMRAIFWLKMKKINIIWKIFICNWKHFHGFNFS